MENNLMPNDWTTRHEKTWLRWLVDWIGRRGVRALEIGTCEGRTAEWLCRNILTGPDSNLDCIDNWKCYADAEAKFDRRVQAFRVRKLKGDSLSILPELKVTGDRYSIIYVDGGHHAETVLFDLVLSWSMLHRGGILIADDYGLFTKNLRLPPCVAIDAWRSCLFDSMAGYEFSKTNQLAVWKR